MKFLILIGLFYFGYRLFFNSNQIEQNQQDDDLEYTDYEELE